MRSFVISALECKGVVYFCANVWDLVLFAIGSLVFLGCLSGLHVCCVSVGSGTSGYKFLIIL